MGIVKTALTASDYVKSFGIYVNQGQSAKNIYEAFIRPESSLLKEFTTIPTQNEIERAVLAKHSRVAQAYKDKWSPTGDITFTPHEIPLYKIKLDVDFYPDQIEKTYLGFLASISTNDREQWPFTKWYVEKFLIPQFNEDVEMNERVMGVYAAPADNTTPAAAGTAMNGIDNIIGNYIADSVITPFASGVFDATPATFVGQVETFIKSIDPKVRKFIDRVHIAKEQEDAWLTGMRTKYNVNWGQVDQAMIYKVVDTNVMVNFVEAQDGHDFMWATVRGNAVRFVKRDVNKLPLVFGKKDIRQIQVSTDMWEGLGFNVPEFVFANDQFTEIV